MLKGEIKNKQQILQRWLKLSNLLMNTPLSGSKKGLVYINGRQVGLTKTPRLSTNVHLFRVDSHIRIQQPSVSLSTPKFQNLSNRLSPQKNVRFSIIPFHSIKSKKVTIDYCSTPVQRLKPILFLQQTRPQSKNEHQFRDTTCLDFSQRKNLSARSNLNDQVVRLRNSQSLRPSLKPQISQLRNRSTVDNELLKYLPGNMESLEEKLQCIEQRLGLENCLKLSKKGEVISYQEIETHFQNQQDVAMLNSNQKPESSKLEVEINMTKCEDTMKIETNISQDEQKIQFIQVDKRQLQHQRNKTSFDNQFPPSQSQNQSRVQQKSSHEQNKRQMGHKRIFSLFEKDQHYMCRNEESNSFEFISSNLQFQVETDPNNPPLNEGYYTEMKPHKKPTVYSKHYSESEVEIQNGDFCQYLESEFNKEHSKTNSSFSLEDFNPLYQREREIMVKYLQSESSSQNISFIQFINELQQLRLQKYTHIKLNSHHQTHLHNEYSSFHQSPLLPSQEPNLLHLINIGQNSQQIEDNRMIIHVISIWLKQMGYLKEQNKLNVIENIKTLFLNAFNLKNPAAGSDMDIRNEQSPYIIKNQNTLMSLNDTFDMKFSPERRYSFNIDTDLTRTTKNAFVNVRTGQSPQRQNNCNSGSKDAFHQSFQSNILRSHSTPFNHHYQLHSPSRGTNERSIEQLIQSIYTSMYYKILPVDLQLLVLFNVCKRGWKFFQFLTVKVLKTIYSHNHMKKNNLKDEKSTGRSLQLENLYTKLQRLVRKMVQQ